MKKSLPDKWLYLPVIVLGIYFLIRLVNQSNLMLTFPLDFANDIPAYLAYLFFLGECGFQQICHYWFNGFISFSSFYPGWVFFTYPLYKLFGNILIAAYVSIILMYLLAFAFIFIFGRNEGFSKIKIIAFFLFLFANAVTVGNMFKLGRVVSLLGICMFFGVAVFVFYYRNRRFGWPFIFLVPIYGFAILSHPQEAILSSFLILSLFLIKKRFYERLIIILVGVLGIILSSFWWIGFVKALQSSSMMSRVQGLRMLDFSGPWMLTNVISLIIAVVFLIMFYYYWVSKKKSKKELLFFSPIIFLDILFLFKLVLFIPVLKDISPDPYIFFFLFFIIYFLFSMDISVFKKLKKIIPVILILVVLISVGVSHFKTPYFVPYGPTNYDTLEIMEYIDGTYLFLNSYVNNYPLAYYGYAPIYLNINSSFGYYYHVLSQDYDQRIRNITVPLREGDCESFVSEAEYFKTDNFVAYEDYCGYLESCGFKKVKEKGVVCLYKLL